MHARTNAVSLALSAAARAGAFVLLGVLLTGAPCHAQDANTLAREHHQRGVDLFEAGRHREALVELRAALQLSPSPNTVLYIARALQGEGRLLEAAAEFDRAAAEASARASSDPRYGATSDAARAERATLGARLGRVNLELPNTPTQGVVRIDGHALDGEARGRPILVAPHAVAIEVEARGYLPEHRRVVVAAGQLANVRLVLVPVTVTAMPRVAPRAGLGAVFGVGIGAGAVGLAAGGTFLGLAAWQQSALGTECATRACTRADTSTGRAFETAMWISLGVGVAALAAATIDAIVTSNKPAHRAHASSGDGLRF